MKVPSCSCFLLLFHFRAWLGGYISLFPPSLTKVTFGLNVLGEFVSLLYFLKGDQLYSCLGKIAGTFISRGQSVVWQGKTFLVTVVRAHAGPPHCWRESRNGSLSPSLFLITSAGTRHPVTPARKWWDKLGTKSSDACLLPAIAKGLLVRDSEQLCGHFPCCYQCCFSVWAQGGDLGLRPHTTVFRRQVGGQCTFPSNPHTLLKMAVL